MEIEDFSRRLSMLRLKKGVSARDMSLSLGQSAGYVNNLENGINYPSMTLFFYICDYFGITPQEFFEIENKNPNKTKELYDISKTLDDESLELLISLAQKIKK